VCLDGAGATVPRGPVGGEVDHIVAHRDSAVRDRPPFPGASGYGGARL